MQACRCRRRRRAPSPLPGHPPRDAALVVIERRFVQLEVIAGTIHEAVQRGDSVTADQFKAGVAELRTEIAGLTSASPRRLPACAPIVANLGKRLATQIATVETRLLRWMVGTVFAAASLAGGILAALLRLVG